MANSAAMRRTHIWQRRYQSRSDDWLYRSLRRDAQERVEMAAEEGWSLTPEPGARAPAWSGSLEAGSSTRVDLSSPFRVPRHPRSPPRPALTCSSFLFPSPLLAARLYLDPADRSNPSSSSLAPSRRCPLRSLPSSRTLSSFLLLCRFLLRS